jgi:hypothetical protein
MKDPLPCFKETIRHEYFNQCISRLHELVRQKTSTGLVIVTGPTGAGKTTMRELFARELELLSEPEMAQNPELISYASCSVKAPGSTAFSWKDTYVQMLISLQHPFANSNLERRQKSHALAGIGDASPESIQRMPNDRLFRILQRTINHRKPKAIFLDEAHHLLRVGSGQSLINQLEHLKYIADETKTLHVLFGTYELIELMDLSSQLIRRREIVHFPRYAYSPANPLQSLESFATVIAVFAQDLDSISHINLLEEVPYLYQGSVGCVGVLRDWLFRAYSMAGNDPDGKISKRILEATKLSSGDLLALLKDAQGGEDYFSKRASKEQEYYSELGFGTAEDNSITESTEPAKKTPSSKPFKRKPHNDPVGLDSLSPEPPIEP